MYRQDIEGSMAHAAMLGATGIIPKEDADKICREWRTNPSNLYVKLIQALYEGAKIIQED